MSRQSTTSDSVRTLAVSDTGFVFDPRTGHAYTVNPTGFMVLRALKEGRSLAQIASDISAEFPDATAVEEDVQAFCSRLSEFGVTSDTQAKS